MPYRITAIEFDFEEDNEILRGTDKEWQEYQDMVIDDVMGTSWVASDDDDLIEEITSYTGWCIKSIEYYLK